MDNFDLQRFVTAQADVYDDVLQELRAGRKQSHWIWFLFPQMKGLGRSETAEYYGISSRLEAEAYLAHAVLGPRLRECTALVLAVKERTAAEIFGFPDDLKFRSSMTLFAEVAPEAGTSVFQQALDKYFGGEGDGKTPALLRSRASTP